MVAAICVTIDTPNFKSSQKIVRENLAPLCTDSGYVYDNIEGSSIHMNYTEYHYESDLEKTIYTNVLKMEKYFQFPLKLKYQILNKLIWFCH